MTWDSLIHWTAVLGAWAAVLWVAVSIVCIAFGERGAKPVEDDQFTPEKPWIPEEMTAHAKAQAERHRRQQELRDMEIAEFRAEMEKQAAR
jgi:hypothetical protein